MKKILSLLFVAVLMYSCSEESIETNSPTTDTAGKTVEVLLVNLPDEVIGEKVYIFSINQNEEIFAIEVADAEEESTVLVSPTPGNAPFDVVAYIPSDEDWTTKDGFVSGYYSSASGETDRETTLITNIWTNSSSKVNSGMDNIVEVDLTINGLTFPDPLDLQFDLGDIVALNASVTNNGKSAIASVSYSVDGSNLITYNEEPYLYYLNTLDLSTGEHDVTVTVTNESGDSAEDEFTIEVSGTTNQGPTVDLLGVTNGASYERQTELTLSASVIDDSGVASVEFRINGSLVFTDTEAPYSYEWDTYDNQVGNVTIMVTAKDDAGVSRSDVANVVLTAPANYDPRVTIVSPSNGSSFSVGATINFDLTVFDDEGDPIQFVDVYLNGGYIGTTTAPYDFSYDTTGDAPGEYTMRVIVYDDNFNNTDDEITYTLN